MVNRAIKRVVRIVFFKAWWLLVKDGINLLVSMVVEQLFY